MDGRGRGRSVVFVVASLFHVIVLSSPPLLLFASPPRSNVRKSADCSLLHLLFHLRIPAE